MPAKWLNDNYRISHWTCKVFDFFLIYRYPSFMASVKAGKNNVKKLGVKGFNKPKLTPSHPKKKAVVVAKEGDQTKVIRFGAKGYGHNYSPEARKSYLARSAGIKGANSKLSANYWARKFLWASGGSKKRPPKK